MLPLHLPMLALHFTRACTPDMCISSRCHITCFTRFRAMSYSQLLAGSQLGLQMNPLLLI